MSQSEDYSEGMIGGSTRFEPRRSLHKLPVLSWALWLSARGLLPVLLDTEPKVVFCRTPVGDDSNLGLESQPSVKRFRDDDEQFLHRSFGVLEVLVKTSPNGPAMEVSQEMGIQLACRWLTSFRTPTPRPM